MPSGVPGAAGLSPLVTADSAWATLSSPAKFAVWTGLIPIDGVSSSCSGMQEASAATILNPHRGVSAFLVGVLPGVVAA